MMFDCHIHADFSTDCPMTLKEAIKASEQNNIGIIITEHLDLNFMIPGEFIFDIEEYFKEYKKYRSDKLLLGIEMGMRPDCVEENIKICEDYPFDFVLGSIHVVRNEDEYYDIYGESFYEERTKEEVYKNYLKYMLNCVKEHYYIDSLSHIDYICRYAPYNDSHIYYEQYNEILDEIFKILISRDKAIEINTRRFKDGEAIKNLIPIYKRFNELGGKIVTLGSDAHRPENIGSDFNLGKQFAEECGLKLVYFKERKPVIVDNK
ncbi:histidinol phosphate phosphatase [Clostridium tetanomorphum]|nr:histidinol phosphate phosphatase [Clostridium tetanomorphum]